MKENIEARHIIKDAILRVRMITRENAMLRNNIKVRPHPVRVAKEMEKLRAAQDALTLTKAAIKYADAAIKTYEQRTRIEIPFEILVPVYHQRNKLT
jgi:hypothetical protein